MALTSLRQLRMRDHEPEPTSSKSKSKSKLSKFKSPKRKDIVAESDISIRTEKSSYMLRPSLSRSSISLNSESDGPLSSHCETSDSLYSTVDWEDLTSTDESQSGLKKKFDRQKSQRKVIKKDRSPNSSHKGKNKPWIHLFDWAIKPIPDRRGVCVEGQKKGMADFWHSSAITMVKKRKFVRTASGTTYRLRGKMNKLCTLDNGFSKDVASAFSDGFPTDWKEVIEDFYKKINDSINIKDECSFVKGQSLNKIRKIKQVKRLKKMEKDIDLDSILTPVGLVKRCNAFGNFCQTRSGRVSRPPLAQWQGQKYVYSSSNMLSVGFDTAAAEKALLDETRVFMKSHMRFQKTMIHKSLSNSMLIGPADNNTSASSILKQCANASKTNVSPCNVKSPNSSDDRLQDSIVEDCEVVLTDCLKKTDTNLTRYKTRVSSRERKKANSNIVKEHVDLEASSSDNAECKPRSAGSKARDSNERNSNGNQTLTSGKKSSLSLRKCHQKKKRVSELVVLNASVNASTVFSPSLNESMVLRSRRKIKKSSPLDYLNRSRADACSPEPKLSRKGSPEVASHRDKSNQLVNTDRDDEAEYSGRLKAHRDRKRKRDSPDAGYCTEDKGSEIELNELTPKAHTSRPDKKRRRLSLGMEKENNGEWTKEEQNSFQRAMETIEGDTEHFWARVSEIVTSRTEYECRQFHPIYLEKNSKSKGTGKSKAQELKILKKKTSGRQKGDPVRAGKGTLKRKEEIREFLKEQNDNYEDNPFDGTPFLARKMIIPAMSNIDFDKDESEIFGDNHRFFTPASRTSNLSTPGSLMRAKLASTKKTPTNIASVSLNETPVSITRQIADKYIHTFKNQQKNKRLSDTCTSAEKQSEITTTPENSGPHSLPHKALFSPSIVMYDKRQEEHEEEEEGNPYYYYWNEDED